METEEKKVYTIDDIANELGVSKTTVSRALSGKGRIGRQTREKVIAFAQQHGYQPNAQARGLAQRKTFNLGMMFPDDYAMIDFPFFKECMNGICETASLHNYDIIVSIMDSRDPVKSCRLVDNRKVDGIILSRSAVGNLPVQKYLKEKQMPFVVVGPAEDDGVVWVDNQNREGSRELTEVLLMKGFRRLALLGGSRTHMVTKSRLKGFLDAHYQYGMEPEEALIFFDVDNYRKTVKAADEILERRVDGIVCMDDFITGMLLGYIREKGIRVPEDLKLASMYDNVQLEMQRPTVTSIRFDTKNLGKKACIALLKLLGETIGPEEETMPNYQLILRESTK